MLGRVHYRYHGRIQDAWLLTWLLGTGKAVITQFATHPWTREGDLPDDASDVEIYYGCSRALVSPEPSPFFRTIAGPGILMPYFSPGNESRVFAQAFSRFREGGTLRQ